MYKKRKRRKRYKPSAKALLKIEIKKTEKYAEWRTAVYARDKKTCQICGKTKKLNAHHLLKFAYLVDKYEIDSLEKAIECDGLWDIKNGQTLCRKCHKKTDNYGNKKQVVVLEEKDSI